MVICLKVYILVDNYEGLHDIKSKIIIGKNQMEIPIDIT